MSVGWHHQAFCRVVQLQCPGPTAKVAPSLWAGPVTESVRSLTGLQDLPWSVLVTWHSRVTLTLVWSWWCSDTCPGTAMKKRKTVPVFSSYRGLGFMERWPSIWAWATASCARHCK